MIAMTRALLMAFARDRGALALAFVAPIAFFALFATFYKHLDRWDSIPIRVALIASDELSERSTRLVHAVESSASSKIQVVRALDMADGFDGAISVLASGSTGETHVIIEARSPLPGIQEVLRGIVQSAARGESGSGAVQISIEDRTEPDRLLRANAVAIPVLFILFALTSLTARGIGDDEAGLAERLASLGHSPIRRLFARVLALVVFATAQMSIALGFGALVFDLVPRDPLALLLAVVASACACAAFVVALAECCGTRARFALVAPIATLTLAGLGGSMIPVEILPTSLAWPAPYMFTRWSIEACASAMSGASITTSLLQLGVFTLGVGVVASLLAQRGRTA